MTVALKRKTATRVEVDMDYTRVLYHGTPVVSFNNTEIILNTGGWRTATTKARMNETSLEFNLNIHVFQRYGDWFVTTNHGTYSFDQQVLSLNR